MDFNNKTLLIGGLVIASIVAMCFNYEQIALAIVSGLVGYLSKDGIPVDQLTDPVDPVDSDQLTQLTDPVDHDQLTSPLDEVSNSDEDIA